MHNSIILWNSPSSSEMLPVHKRNTAFSCNVLVFLLNKQKNNVPEVEYGHTGRPDQHVLFFGCFDYICACAPIIKILIFSLSTDLYITIFQISNSGINAI